MPIILKKADATNASYELYRSEGARAEYRGEQHNDLVTDSLVISATEPKKTSNSNGNRRALMKILRTMVVSAPNGVSTEKKDAKIEIATSLPVGATAADIGELLARAAQMLLTSELAVELVQQGKIQH